MERRTIFPALATVSLLLCFGIIGVVADASNHRYKPEETVPLYANKVGPFHNPRLALFGECASKCENVLLSALFYIRQNGSFDV